MRGIFILKKMCELTKKCRNCLEEKELGEFSKNVAKKDKLSIYCKECEKVKSKRTREQSKIIPKTKLCKDCNKNKKEDCFYRQCSSADGLSYYCITCSVVRRKEQYNKRRDKDAEYHKQKRTDLKRDNPEKLKQQDRKANAKSQERVKERIKEDFLFKLSKNVRTRVLYSFTSTKKSKRTEEVLGCSFEEFKAHIESQFINWMSWRNYGNVCGTELSYNCSWDLDHIIPISYAKTEEEIYLLNHWSNFQPLCSKVNREIKKNKFTILYNLELKIGSKYFKNK